MAHLYYNNMSIHKTKNKTFKQGLNSVFTITIKLLSPFVGSSKLQNNTRKILRVGDNGHPKLFLTEFSRVFAAHALANGNFKSKNDAINSVCFSNIIQVDKKYNSVFSMIKGIIFETYKVGTEMKIVMSVSIGKINKDDITKIFNRIGAIHGISHYKADSNLGLFEVINVKD